MISLSNGHKFQYMVASGALAFDGKGWLWEKPLVWLGLIDPKLFTVVIKTVTRTPRAGNLRWTHPWSCVRLLPGDGAVNKIGLTNIGIDAWCQNVGSTMDFKNYRIVGSMLGNCEELVYMARRFNEFNFDAVEVNFSCPNVSAEQEAGAIIESMREIKKVSRHPLIIKISVDKDFLTIAEELFGIAEAVSINSVPWKLAFPNGDVTPLWRLEKKVAGGGGGVSGKPAQKLNWEAVEKLAKQGLLPVIGPSIMEHGDLRSLERLGASAFSFGAIHLRTPCKATQIVRKEMIK